MYKMGRPSQYRLQLTAVCGGDKAGIAPIIGMNNAEFRHVIVKVSIAMISAELKGADAVQGLQKGFVN